MRKGIGLIWALIILLLIATLMTAVTKIAFFSVKHTSDTYMIQRAQLFMQSAIENAILAIEGYDRNKNDDCLKFIHFRDEDGRFEANISVLRYYIYGKCPSNCKICKPIQTDFSNGYVLMDVKVATLNDNKKNDNKKILLEKVTLQRP